MFIDLIAKALIDERVFLSLFSGFSTYYLVAENPLLTAAATIAGWQIGGGLGDKKIGDLIVYRNFKYNGSFANKQRLEPDSIRWSTFDKVKNILSNKCDDNSFYVDNFRFVSPIIKNNLNIYNKYLAKRAENENRCMKWSDLKKGNLVIGSMGQGKTELLNNIITQWIETNRKMIIHDTKGEFTSWFYRDDKDYIINHLDKRGAYWDFFEDNERGLPYSLIAEFFNSYFIATAGEQGDKFWQEMAALRFQEIFEALKLNKNIPTDEKMSLLVEELLEYLAVVKKSGNKTEQSIATTLEAAMEIFLKFAYMAKRGHKKILLTDFFNSDGDNRIFLHTIEAVAKENTPFLTAFLTVMMRYQLTYKEKAKEDEWILYALDEYLTFFNKMNEDIRKAVHTKARSYGMLLLPAIQYLPNDDDLKEILLSSVENLWIFAITEEKTIKTIKDFAGKVKIAAISQKAKNKSDKTEFKEEEKYLIDENILKSLKTGMHITYLPKKSVIYAGYTKLAKVSEIAQNFIQESYADEYDYISYKVDLKNRAEQKANIKLNKQKSEVANKLFNN